MTHGQDKPLTAHNHTYIHTAHNHKSQSPAEHNSQLKLQKSNIRHTTYNTQRLETDIQELNNNKTTKTPDPTAIYF